jgi:HEAT repeat protein
MKALAPVLSSMLLLACSGLDDLRKGDLDVPPRVILRAGDSSDAALEPPLLAILDRRISGGYTRMDDERVVQAIRALVMRRSENAVPRFEQLLFDPVAEVRFQALVALDRLESRDSLPLVAALALGDQFTITREEAYRVFSDLSGVMVNDLDSHKLRQVLADHEGAAQSSRNR